jgi:Protein of unknown function (DUF3106)
MGLSTILAEPSIAQRGRVNSPSPQHAPPRSQARPPSKPPQHQQPKNPPKAAQQERRPGSGGSRQGDGANRPDNLPHPNGNPNRPPSAYTPPQPPKKLSDLPPQERQKIIENNNRYRNLPPAQRQEIEARKKTWDALTPEQQSHIKNDVLPRWKQMPVERRQAIRQRLRVLQNMPESAKNQRLNDPNFTRGMSEEDRATLRDLSHMHVGAPDPPGE